nr:hypothetical protein [Morchella crassipes]
MWIVGYKPGEFQERLALSQLEAKHHLIFDPVVYLVIIRCIRVYLIMRSSCFKYVRSTTSRWVKKDNNSTTSTRGLALYFTISNFIILNKTTIRLLMAWLCFLFLSIGVIIPDCDYICLFVLVTTGR